jgi:hypothetical protein
MKEAVQIVKLTGQKFEFETYWQIVNANAAGHNTNVAWYLQTSYNLRNGEIS